MASSYLQKFPVPDGFPELLHDLLKSILKEQPEDIIEFSYHYFKNKHEGLSEPKAENKNYYGKQIKKQIKQDSASVIRKPKPGEEEMDDAEGEKEHASEKEEKSQSQKSKKKSSEEGDRSDHGGAKSDKTHTSNMTKKEAINEYYNDLTDKVLEHYEEGAEEANSQRPKTSDNQRDVSASSKKSMPSKPQAIKEEVNETEEDPDQKKSNEESSKSEGKSSSDKNAEGASSKEHSHNDEGEGEGLVTEIDGEQAEMEENGDFGEEQMDDGEEGIQGEEGLYGEEEGMYGEEEGVYGEEEMGPGDEEMQQGEEEQTNRNQEEQHSGEK